MKPAVKVSPSRQSAMRLISRDLLFFKWGENAGEDTPKQRSTPNYDTPKPVCRTGEW
jgi:hypothetical protein